MGGIKARVVEVPRLKDQSVQPRAIDATAGLVCCDLCRSLGPRWPVANQPFSVAEKLCFGCGQHLALTGQRRPVLFRPAGQRAEAEAEAQALASVLQPPRSKSSSALKEM